jgi:hypothetical protein
MELLALIGLKYERTNSVEVCILVESSSLMGREINCGQVYLGWMLQKLTYVSVN